MLNTILEVFIPPIRTRNNLLFIFLKTIEPIAAACAAPSPGSVVVNKLEINIRENTFNISNFFIIGVVIIWVGIFTLLLRLVIKVLVPNNPESKGNKTFFISREKAAIPKVPEARNKIRAHNLEFFSFKIIRDEMKININGIYLCTIV